MRTWKWSALQSSLGWESLGPMKSKNYLFLQSKKVTIPMTNGIGGFIFPLSWWGPLNLILIFSVRWPHIPLFHPNYFK
jgi:hypothetical protein